jgi:hypothetical protein
MTRIRLIGAMLVIGTLAAHPLRADDVTYEESNGVRYQVTRQVVPRLHTETHYEPRQYTAYRERYTTEMQEVPRTYQVPVTEQQWVPGYQRSLNIFAPPVLTYRLMPVTRWETRTDTVRVPSTRKDYVPETATQHVPVTTQHLVQEEHTHRVFAGTTGSGTGAGSVASNSGGTGASTDGTAVGGLNKVSDPPRDASLDQQIDRRR